MVILYRIGGRKASAIWMICYLQELYTAAIFYFTYGTYNRDRTKELSKFLLPHFPAPAARAGGEPGETEEKSKKYSQQKRNEV